LDLFTNIIEKIHHHTQYVYLHVKGEPLLHAQLSEILDLCNDKKLKVVVVTNGTLLKQKGDLLLTKPALKQVNISLHCFSELKQLIDKDEYLTSIIHFTKNALSKSNLYISLKLWNYNKNINEKNTENEKIIDVIEKELTPGKDLKNLFKPGTGIKLAERLYLNSDFKFIWPDLKNEFTNTKGYCHALRDHLAILRDGTVVPCCLDAEGVINLGNIQEKSLQEIIDSQRAQNIYNGFANRVLKEPLCQKCGFIEKFSTK
jgi:radical SAM protein with 4Fe4S-binding SPASM domain